MKKGPWARCKSGWGTSVTSLCWLVKVDHQRVNMGHGKGVTVVKFTRGYKDFYQGPLCTDTFIFQISECDWV